LYDRISGYSIIEVKPYSILEDDMPELPIVAKPVIEQIFDDAAASYDQVGPSIFTQFGKRLVDHMDLLPECACWTLPRAREQHSYRQRIA